jgi:hypothetical protein
MATALTSSPYVDHRAFAQAGKGSPFRSHDGAERVQAAEVMLIQRQAELASLELALSTATSAIRKKALRLRIQATRANVASWEDYLEGGVEDAEPAYREPRAVMTPYIRPNPLVVH